MGTSTYTRGISRLDNVEFEGEIRGRFAVGVSTFRLGYYLIPPETGAVDS